MEKKRKPAPKSGSPRSRKVTFKEVHDHPIEMDKHGLSKIKRTSKVSRYKKEHIERIERHMKAVEKALLRGTFIGFLLGIISGLILGMLVSN